MTYDFVQWKLDCQSIYDWMCAEGSNKKTELPSGSHFVMWLKTIRYLHYSGYTFITQDIPGAVS